MKKIISLLLALVLVLGLAACGAKTDAPAADAPAADAPAAAPVVDENNPLYTKPTEEVALTVWYAVSGVTATKFEALVKEYQEANPNVKIELSYAGSYADAANKISANLLTNTAPDVALTTAAPMFTGDRGDYTIETLIQDPAFDADGIYDGVWECTTTRTSLLRLVWIWKTILPRLGTSCTQWLKSASLTAVQHSASMSTTSHGCSRACWLRTVTPSWR